VKGVIGALGPEFDLSCLQVAVQGGEPEGGGVPVYHAHGPVPRPGHAHDELVTLLQAIFRAASLAEDRHFGRSLIQLGCHHVDQRRRAYRAMDDPHGVRAMQQGSDTRFEPLAPVTTFTFLMHGVRQVRLTARFFRAMKRGGPPQVAPADHRNSYRPAQDGPQPGRTARRRHE
jgi:hypothetical protein